MELWTKWWRSFSAILNSGFRSLALFLIAFYRATLSLWFGGHCRFEPSCSVYAQTAFQKHKPITALGFTLRRLSKCHPLGPYGFDPVPDQRGHLE